MNAKVIARDIINAYIPGEIYTKAELFKVIRELTAAGWFFEIRNGFNGNGRAFYMVNVLSNKSE